MKTSLLHSRAFNLLLQAKMKATTCALLLACISVSLEYSAAQHRVKRGSSNDYGNQRFNRGYRGDSDYDLLKLVTIAQNAADQASSAASRQQSAGHVAAYQVTSSLADTAVANAAAAHAAKSGKQAIVSSLQRQLNEVHAQIEAEAAQLQQAESAARGAQQVVQQTRKQVSSLRSSLEAALDSSDQAQQASWAASQEAASQAAMLSQAQQRRVDITQRLDVAQSHLAATQRAEDKAFTAASAAQVNANQHGESNGIGWTKRRPWA